LFILKLARANEFYYKTQYLRIVNNHHITPKRGSGSETSRNAMS